MKAKDSGERAVWWSKQDLNDADRHGRRSFWRCARAWLHAGRATLGIEWHLPTRQIGGWLALGGEERDVQVGLHLWPLLTVYLYLQGLVDKRRHRWWWEYHRYGLQIDGGYVWLDWNSDEWGEKDRPRWGLNWKRALFGRCHHAREHRREPQRAELAMPEGVYPCTVTLYRSWWWYDRWPFPWSIDRADVDFGDHPVPIPGKGDNGWDLDEDATFSVTLPAETVDEALNKVREDILERRERYGGRDWRPAGVEAA